MFNLTIIVCKKDNWGEISELQCSSHETEEECKREVKEYIVGILQYNRYFPQDIAKEMKMELGKYMKSLEPNFFKKGDFEITYRTIQDK